MQITGTWHEARPLAFVGFPKPAIPGPAEADDPLRRGRNIATRTPASACRFVA